MGAGTSREGLVERLERPGRPLLLDGATGTELERAEVQTGLPLWSSHALLEAPDVVREIHRSYLEAGSDIVTANTFRTQRRTLARAGLADRDGELTRLAVTLAREAVDEVGGAAGGRFVAGSQPPLEDCYRPDLVPTGSELQCEHVRHSELLAESGVDLILVETMNSIGEATAAIRAAVGTGLRVVAGFVSWERDRILSGEPLGEAAARALEAGASVVGVNCVPPSSLSDAWACLAPLGAPLFVAPNLGEPEPETGFARAEEVGPEDFCACLAPWITPPSESPVALVGGCCGTTPAHIRALAARLG